MNDNKQSQERIKWIEYKGKRMLFADFSGLRGKAHLMALEESIDAIKQEPKGTVLLYLIDTTDTYTTPEIKAKVEESYKILKDKTDKHFVALVGANLATRIILSFMHPELKMEKTIDNGKEWLLQQALQFDGSLTVAKPG